jgi:hypothetical protein
MVQLSVIEAQLHQLGAKRTFFSTPEIRELCHILLENEKITKFVSGRYNGGFAILVATQLRLLLIDKKPLYLTVEDIRYDMISEVDIGARMFDATVTVFTVNKKLIFTSVKQRKLRELTAYVQQRVMEMRSYQHQDQSYPIQAQEIQLPPLPTSASTHQMTAHVPQIHNPIQGVLAHTREHIPGHIPQAVGNAATKLASRWHHHNPNPYTKEPLMVRKQWSGWSDPPITPTYEPET